MPQGLLERTADQWLFIVDKDKTYAGGATFKKVSGKFPIPAERTRDFGCASTHKKVKLLVPLEFL